MVNALESSVSVQRSLSVKFSCMVVLILSLTLGTASYLNYKAQHEQLKQQLINRGDTLGTFIAFVSPDAILGYDLLLLDQYMRQVTLQQDVVYSVVVSVDDKVLTRYVDRNHTAFRALRQGDLLDYLNTINTRDDIVALTYPIFHADQSLGYLMLGLSSQRVDDLSVAALKNNLLVAFAITLLLSIGIYLAFRYSVLRPVNKLNLGLRSITEGDLQHRVEIDSLDELGRVGIAFNSMTESLQKSYQELRTANQELMAATKAKSDFLANMSHEIRTPLTAIIGFGESLLDEMNTPAERFSAVNTIIRNGNLLKKIINDILDLSKIEAGKLEIDIVSTQTSELLRDIDDLIGMQSRSKGLLFEVLLKSALPETIETDPIRLKQILINLCGNAVKFTERGKVTLEVSYDSNDKTLCFQVADTGIGIAAEKIDKIFVPFEQADISTTRLYGGTGLGLTLVKRLALMLGGDVSAQSEPGQGSVFTVQFPVTPVNDRMMQPRSISPIDSPMTVTDSSRTDRLHGHILLVEDDDNNAQSILQDLDTTRFVVHQARDGNQAIKMLDDEDYDLLIVDARLRSVDAAELIEFIRGADTVIPIVSLRDSVTGKTSKRCKQGGCNEIIDLPLNTGELETIIAKYLPTDPIENKNGSQDNHKVARPGALHAHQLKGRVLLAEDTVDNQRLFSLYLKNSGIELNIVENGERAVHEALAGDYDLVLMDMQMPVMGGLEATQRLRAKGFNTPIIALTANALKHDREAYFSAGCSDFISKPVTKKRLLSALSQYLPAAEHNRSPAQAQVLHASCDVPSEKGDRSLQSQYSCSVAESMHVASVEMQEAFRSLQKLNAYFAQFNQHGAASYESNECASPTAQQCANDSRADNIPLPLLRRLEDSRELLENVLIGQDWQALSGQLPILKSIADEQNNLKLGCLCCHAEEHLNTGNYPDVNHTVSEIVEELQISYKRLKNNAELVRLATDQCPLTSQLDHENDPELIAALDAFVSGLVVMQTQVNELHSKENWGELSRILHNLKGTGGAFGYPLLTEVTRDLHYLLRREEYHKLHPLLSLFNTTCYRIIAGRDEAKSVKTGT